MSHTCSQAGRLVATFFLLLASLCLSKSNHWIDRSTHMRQDQVTSCQSFHSPFLSHSRIGGVTKRRPFLAHFISLNLHDLLRVRVFREDITDSNDAQQDEPSPFALPSPSIVFRNFRSKMVSRSLLPQPPPDPAPPHHLGRLGEDNAIAGSEL